MVTSNHIHLLVADVGVREVIPKSLQLIAGRTGQEYNQRKNRKGAFWEDRYHATAVSSDHHLIQCMVYIDLNMVRAGAVNHPSEWNFGGYNEIHKPHECAFRGSRPPVPDDSGHRFQAKAAGYRSEATLVFF